MNRSRAPKISVCMILNRRAKPFRVYSKQKRGLEDPAIEVSEVLTSSKVLQSPIEEVNLVFAKLVSRLIPKRAEENLRYQWAAYLRLITHNQF